MKMEPIEGSETSALRTKTPWNCPKEDTLHIEHGESLKSSTSTFTHLITFSVTCSLHTQVKAMLVLLVLVLVLVLLRMVAQVVSVRL